MIQAIVRLTIASIIIAIPVSKVEPQDTPCPTMLVECLSTTCCKSPFDFVVHVTGGIRPPTLVHKWTVTNGKIVSGQGTSRIKVVSKDWEIVTATVELEGPDPRCPGVASITQTICDSAPSLQLFDQYPLLSSEKELLRLDRFANFLQSESSMQGYILVTGHRDRAEEAKTYLVVHHRIEAKRLVASGRKTVRGKMKTILYVVPAGATIPKL